MFFVLLFAGLGTLLFIHLVNIQNPKVKKAVFLTVKRQTKSFISLEQLYKSQGGGVGGQENQLCTLLKVSKLKTSYKRYFPSDQRVRGLEQERLNHLNNLSKKPCRRRGGRRLIYSVSSFMALIMCRRCPMNGKCPDRFLLQSQIVVSIIKVYNFRKLNQENI